MRLTVRILLLVSLFAFGVPTFAGAGPPCTRVGTQGSDDLNGTDSRDVLCGRAGPDYINGRAAADITQGGKGNDTLVGGSGPDDLIGRFGDDQLFATDGAPGDDLNCGRGRDKAYGDQGDRFFHCEHKVKL